MADSQTSSRVIRTIAEMRAAVREAQVAGETVGIVPTMGALHAGHLSLVEASKARCDRTVVTIFVNPTQFLPGEDLEKYPRTWETDLAAVSERQVDWVFAPSVEEIYGTSAASDRPTSGARIDVGPVAAELEGRFRPGHFDGVATVVMKLFQIAPADVAFFGQKDYQQTCVVRQMCTELNVPIEIAVCPTAREPDGLALSSRNRFLSDSERDDAVTLSRSLHWAAQQVDDGNHDAKALIHGIRAQFQPLPDARVEYVAIVEPNTMRPLQQVAGRAVILVAARIGATRLIDNRIVESGS